MISLQSGSHDKIVGDVFAAASNTRITNLTGYAKISASNVTIDTQIVPNNYNWGVEILNSSSVNVYNLIGDSIQRYLLYASYTKNLVGKRIKLKTGSQFETGIRTMEEVYNALFEDCDITNTLSKQTDFRIHYGTGHRMLRCNGNGISAFGIMGGGDGGQNLGINYWRCAAKNGILLKNPTGALKALITDADKKKTLEERKRWLNYSMSDFIAEQCVFNGAIAIHPISNAKFIKCVIRGVKSALNVAGLPFVDLMFSYPDPKFRLPGDVINANMEVTFDSCEFWSDNPKEKNLTYGGVVPKSWKFINCKYNGQTI